MLLAGLVVVRLLNAGEPTPRGPVADAFRFLVGPVGDMFFYGAAFGPAGVGAVGSTEAARRVSTRGLSADD